LTSAACRAGVQAMGLSLWAAQERFASPTATAVRIPPGVDAAALLKAVRANYGVLFSSGSGETEGKLVLIGHMGPNARPIYAIVAVAALGGALASIGHTVDVGAGVKAAMAVIDRGH
jgi:pyridoxamine---pyruvate transaminase